MKHVPYNQQYTKHSPGRLNSPCLPPLWGTRKQNTSIQRMHWHRHVVDRWTWSGNHHNDCSFKYSHIHLVRDISKTERANLTWLRIARSAWSCSARRCLVPKDSPLNAFMLRSSSSNAPSFPSSGGIGPVCHRSRKFDVAVWNFQVTNQWGCISASKHYQYVYTYKHREACIECIHYIVIIY